MTTVYIEQQNAPELPFSLVFWPNFTFKIKESRLFLRGIMEQYTEPFFTIVDRPEIADFFAVPYEYFDVQDHFPDYLSRVYAHARSLGKKVLLFDYTDYVDRPSKLPSHAILFRVSVYRHHKATNEIVMPYFVEDFGERHSVRPKEKGIPLTVGYCGYARFGSMARKWKALAKWSAHSLRLLVSGDANRTVHARGIFWRQRAIQELRKSDIPRRIIERPFYSGHRAAVTMDADTIRHEYVKNLSECDLALCVRGDANASQRFYEALSASRIPLFIDTDCALPLEEIISYDEFLIRVSSNEIARIAEKIQSGVASLSPEAFLEKERKARTAYASYLCLDRYLARIFDRNESPYKDVLFV